MGTNDWVSKPQVEKSPAEATEPASLAEANLWGHGASASALNTFVSGRRRRRKTGSAFWASLPTGREIKECLLEFRC
jgi:hypothetical protein